VPFRFFNQNRHYDIRKGEPQWSRQIHLNWILLQPRETSRTKKKIKYTGGKRGMGPWAFGVPLTLVSTLGLLLNGYVLLIVLGLGKQVNNNDHISIKIREKFSFPSLFLCFVYFLCPWCSLRESGFNQMRRVVDNFEKTARTIHFSNYCNSLCQKWRIWEICADRSLECKLAEFSWSESSGY